MRRHLKTRFPHLRVRRLKGTVYTDTWFSWNRASKETLPYRSSTTRTRTYPNYPMKTKPGPIGPGTIHSEVGAPMVPQRQHAHANEQRMEGDCESTPSNLRQPSHTHRGRTARKRWLDGRSSECLTASPEPGSRPALGIRTGPSDALQEPNRSVGNSHPTTWSSAPRPTAALSPRSPSTNRSCSWILRELPDPNEVPGRWVGLAKHAGDILTYVVGCSQD